MGESREKNLINNIFVLAIGVFFPKLAVFISLPILTGCLTKIEYGTYDLVLTLVSLLLPAATLQIQTAAFRFLIDYRENENEKKSIITNINIFITPVFIIVLLVLYLILGINSDNSLLRIEICLYFMIDLLNSTTRQITRGLGKNSIYTMSTFVSSITQITGTGLFVWLLKMGLKGAILSLSVGELLSYLYLCIKIKIWNYIDLKLVNMFKIKKMLQYSWPMVPNSLSMWVMRVSDRFVVTAAMGVAVNAVYAVAYKIPSILTLAQSTFNMAWQENASLVSNDHDASDYYTSVFEKIYDTSAGMMSALIGVTPFMFTLLVRGDYDEAYPQIIILYLAIFFFVISTFWGGLYVAYQKTKSVGLTAAVAAAINIAVDVILIKKIGLYAASGSTLVSYLFLCIFRLIDSKKFIKIRYDFKHIFIVLAILIMQCIISVQRTMLLDISSFGIGMMVFLLLNKTIVMDIWRKSVVKRK